MPAATLREVAAKAGVATSTVSRALRNHPNLPLETRERLQALAREMGYRPDPLITALVDRRWNRTSREAGTIAWVGNSNRQKNKRNWFYQELLRGARERAESLGFGLEEFLLRESGMTNRRLSSILLNRGIRGLCVAPLEMGHGHLNLRWEHFSCATIGYSMMRPDLHRAAPHQFQDIMEALRQLRKKGYRRIGFYMTRQEHRKVNYHWMAGALLFAQLYPEVKCSVRVDDGLTLPKFRDWIRTEKLEVVLGSNEGVTEFLRLAKVNLPAATLLRSPTSSLQGIDQQLSDVGAAAIDLIVGQIRRNEFGVPAKPRVVMVSGEWRE